MECQYWLASQSDRGRRRGWYGLTDERFGRVLEDPHQVAGLPAVDVAGVGIRRGARDACQRHCSRVRQGRVPAARLHENRDDFGGCLQAGCHSSGCEQAACYQHSKFPTSLSDAGNSKGAPLLLCSNASPRGWYCCFPSLPRKRAFARHSAPVNVKSASSSNAESARCSRRRPGNAGRHRCMSPH